MSRLLMRYSPGLDVNVAMCRLMRCRHGIDRFCILQFSMPLAELDQGLGRSALVEIDAADRISGRPGWTVNRLMNADEKGFCSWGSTNCLLLLRSGGGLAAVYLVRERVGTNVVMIVVNPE